MTGTLTVGDVDDAWLASDQRLFVVYIEQAGYFCQWKTVLWRQLVGQIVHPEANCNKDPKLGVFYLACDKSYICLLILTSGASPCLHRCPAGCRASASLVLHLDGPPRMAEQPKMVRIGHRLLPFDGLKVEPDSVPAMLPF